METVTKSGISGLRRFLTYHLPAILYAGLVVGLSSIPYLKGPSLKFIAFDKLAHFLEYSIFAFLTFRSFSHLTMRITSNRAFLLSILFLSVFALLDEFHQSFVPGRHADVADLGTDIAGAFLVIAFMWIRRRRLASEKGQNGRIPAQ
jgi:VanZ family protein